jgi:hypothetical protein
MALVETKISSIIDEKISEDNTADLVLFPKIFSGTGEATAVQMSKIGDIYVKTDTSKVYVAKGVTKASDWVEVSTAS